MSSSNGKNKAVGAALVVGGGVGGMQAALDLADCGVMVYLIEDKPSIGGVMAQLDKTFPTNDCSMCMLAPRLVEVGRNPNIKVITYAQVEKLEGEAGNFKAVVRKRARFIDETICVGCGDCWSKCPVRKPIPSEFDAGLSLRRAVYRPYPQAIPNIATIDKENCIFFQTGSPVPGTGSPVSKQGKCKACEKLCKAKAVNFEQKDELITLEVGGVVLATGYDVFDANKAKELGYGRFPNVVTSLEFERILSASGPFLGKVLRPSDKNHPKKVAFIQCVGSRDSEHNYCSSVCCMYATKEAILAKEHEPGLECTIFYIDLRAFGKGFDAYYERAKQAGIRYVRARPSSIKQIPDTKNLKIRYFSEEGRVAVEEFDMAVLSVGLGPHRLSDQVKKVFGVKSNEHGFCLTTDSAPVESSREGVFVCGPFTEPK
ncbi:MAG: CoB--CoM heterodisulfide reductase iron-sulfur subunit A family protein, partial [Elusimicrobia bacterium]|nr:CoB--CoM heterodisulfide reductase iron-sulfur subunit A family protein [Elusimicrobiota bacterium]